MGSRCLRRLRHAAKAGCTCATAAANAESDLVAVFDAIIWHKVYRLDKTRSRTLAEATRRITDSRSAPAIPTSAIWFSVFFGAVFKTPSFLQLQSETHRQTWRNTFGCDKPISHDSMGYITARMHLDPLRWTLATTNKLLKRNKAFTRNQISGLLAVNIDAICLVSRICG